MSAVKTALEKEIKFDKVFYRVDFEIALARIKATNKEYTYKEFRTPSLVVSDLHPETKVSQLDSAW